MTTHRILLSSEWQQITDGIQDYVILVPKIKDDNSVEITLCDNTPDNGTPSFKISEVNNISSTEYKGKVWVRSCNNGSNILIINK